MFTISIKKLAVPVAVSITAAGSVFFCNISHAATVPPGVVLAKQQVINKGAGAEPATLDPQKIEGVPASHVADDLFEGLVINSPAGEPIPGVATHWTISKNGKVYTFFLRKNAKWSNGKPVTASDFVYAFQRAENPKTASPYAYFLYPVVNARAINSGKASISSLGVVAINPTTLKITLNRPTPYFLQALTAPVTFPVYPPDIKHWKSSFTQAGHLISNGAYKLTYWVINDHITLKRNPYYWNNAHTVINTVNYYPVNEPNTEMKMFASGQLDYTYEVPSNQFKLLKKRFGNELHVSPMLGIYYDDINLTKAPFKNNTKLRQALSMAINRKALTQYVLGNGVIPLFNFIPKGTHGITSIQYPWANWPYAKKIQEAKKLYQQAGFSKKHPLSVTITYNTNADHKKIALAVAAMWQQALGVKVTLENQEWKVFIANRENGNYTVARDGWLADYNYPTTFLNMWTCNSQENNPKYCNPQYDAILNQASLCNDAQKRMKLYQKAESLAMKDYAIIPLFQYVNTHLVKNYVGGYQQTNPMDMVYTKNWYIIKHQH